MKDLDTVIEEFIEKVNNECTTVSIVAPTGKLLRLGTKINCDKDSVNSIIQSNLMSLSKGEPKGCAEHSFKIKQFNDL